MIDNIKYKTAVHEAAHVFMYFFVGHTFEKVDLIENENKTRYGGISGGKPIIEEDELVEFKKGNLSSEIERSLKDCIDNLILIYLAGYETERLLNLYDKDEDNEFESFDYKRACKLAQSLSVRYHEENTISIIEKARDELRKILFENISTIKDISNFLIKYNPTTYEILRDTFFKTD